MAELKEELDNPKEDRKKDAVKKVIAAMTVGKDVSPLFTDVVKCMNTQNLELKKLVYLYIMNYAKSNPDLAILAVNTFVQVRAFFFFRVYLYLRLPLLNVPQDAQHPNPLIRALAVRTMGCIRVNRITEYLCEPLRKCLKVCLSLLTEKLTHCFRTPIPMCARPPPCVLPSSTTSTPSWCTTRVSSTCCATSFPTRTQWSSPTPSPLSPRSRRTPPPRCSASTRTTSRSSLLRSMSAPSGVRCVWLALNMMHLAHLRSQVFILNSLASYTPKDAREAETICERVTPRLQHANSAVVLGAVKVLMKYMDAIQSQEVIKGLCKKMAPPLVTLLSKEPEIQYVALRNINLIIQKRSAILQYEMKVRAQPYSLPFSNRFLYTGLLL